MSKKNKILIALLTSTFLLFLVIYKININKNLIEKSSPLPIDLVSLEKNPLSPFSKEKVHKNEISNLVTLEINDLKYETEILGPTNIDDLMQKLQNEGKINFKYETYAGMGKFIEEINGIKNDKKNWIYYVNGEKANIGISNYKIKSGDVVSWKYEENY